MKDITNKEKFQKIYDLYNKIQYLDTTINGLDEVIREPSCVNRIYGDEHELCVIKGVDYEVVGKAFNAAKQVFVEEYEKSVDSVNNLLK